MRAQDRKVPYQALSTSFRGAKCRLGEPCNYRSPSDLIYRKCYGKRRRSRSRSPIDLAACSAAEPSSAGSSLCSRRCGGVALAEKKKSADRRRLGRAARSEQNTNQVVVGGRSRFALSSHCDGVFGGAVDDWPKTSGTTGRRRAGRPQRSRRPTDDYRGGGRQGGWPDVDRYGPAIEVIRRSESGAAKGAATATAAGPSPDCDPPRTLWEAVSGRQLAQPFEASRKRPTTGSRAVPELHFSIREPAFGEHRPNFKHL